MRVYYNEIDPFCIAWLRALMAAKVIADGELDTRPIESVSADDLRGFTRCHFFAGLGGWEEACRLAEWGDRELWTGSCPCQPWSVAGKGEGPTDPRDLWPTWERLIGERRPATIAGEQTASSDGLYWLDRVYVDLEARAYAVAAVNLPAACVGAFHRRQRLWFVADCDGARLRTERGAGSHRERHARPQLDDRSGSRLLADPHGSGVGEHARKLSGDEGQYDERTPDGDYGARPGGTARCVADPERAAWRPDAVRGADHLAEEAGRQQGASGARERGAARDVADTQGGGLGVERHASEPADPGHAHQRGTIGELGDTPGQRHEGRANGRPPGSGREGSAHERAGATGFWDAVEWIPCLDGKARPIEPGTFPLAHGVPARVGRLRGYGNAIVPEVGALVLRAYRESRGY